MIAYVVRRVLFAISLLLGISFASFAAFGLSLDHTYPLLLGGEKGLEQRRLLQVKYHLTAPIFERYWHWLQGLFTHGFGTTVMPVDGPAVAGNLSGTDINPLVWQATAVTAQLVAVSLVVVVLVSAGTGALAAQRPGGAVDLALRVLGYVTWSVPTFVIGIVLLQWFGKTSRLGRRAAASGRGSATWRCLWRRSRSASSASTAATCARRCSSRSASSTPWWRARRACRSARSCSGTRCGTRWPRSSAFSPSSWERSSAHGRRRRQ